MYSKTKIAKLLGIPILLLGIMLTWSSCSDQDTLETHEKMLKSSSTNDLMTIRFDLEHYISTVPIDPAEVESLHQFDKMNTIPQLKRDKGTLRVKADNSVEVTLELVDATNEVVIPHQVPEDPNRKKPAYIVIKNDIAKTYDAENTLLHEEKIDMIAFKNIVDLIHDGKYGIAPTLEETFIKVNENDRYEVYEHITENGKTTMAKDIENNRLAFTEMHDADGKIAARQIFQYDENGSGDYPLIKRTVQFLYKKSIEGTVDMITTITTDFKVFHISDNI